MVDRDGFRNKETIRQLHGAVHTSMKRLGRDVTIMEVCGSHTLALSRFGIRALLPAELSVVSGPGCPICVTDAGEIDSFISLADRPSVTLVSFGDTFRIPGKTSSLSQKQQQGGDIRLAYSPLDGLRIAKDNPHREVVFLALGFETTAPTIAATLKLAEEEGVNNFFIYSVLKTIPPVLHYLLKKDFAPEGLLCPGHVGTIIGSQPFSQLSKQYNVPMVMAGFEPADILLGIYQLIEILRGRKGIDNCYPRAVKPEGNRLAQSLIDRYFQPAVSWWRGIGNVDGSGLILRPKYGKFDARIRFDLPILRPEDLGDCCCGEVLLGRKLPRHCPQFGLDCTPQQPLGPCMVSREGACSTYYYYDYLLKEGKGVGDSCEVG